LIWQVGEHADSLNSLLWGETHMKKVMAAAAGTLALALAAPASAADLAARPYTKAPPPAVAAIYDWSGFYIGINGGGGSAHKCWDFVTPVTGTLVGEGCHNATGGTVGGQVGYRWQSANWVFGLEGQGNWADFSGDNVSLAFPGTALVTGDRNRSRIDSFGLLTGQVGYAWNSVLLYVKGGGAVVGDKYDIYAAAGTPGAGALLASARETRWGATVGAGLEFGFAPNWSVGVEYNHIFLGHRTLNFTTPAGAFFGSDRIGQDVDMGLVRLNYRFGGPLVARY
jgi:outer membrane immunogenic protein